MRELFLEHTNWRIPLTVLGSMLIHFGLLSLYGSSTFTGGPAKQLKLTEIEYQEEAAKPTDMEKLMHKLAAPAKPEPGFARSEAVAALERESFSQVAGLKASLRMDEVTEANLTRLAALPESYSTAAKITAPAIQPLPNVIVLKRSEASPEQALASQVVPIDDLPPADFSLDIARKKFQAPELIIKSVKAERQKPAAQVDTAKKLSLERDTFIFGEIKNREILHRENPVVPRWLEEKGIEVEVIINFVVNPDGDVGDKMYVNKTSGYAELDQLAIEALKQFTFAPLPLTDRQVEQKGTIVIRFAVHKQ